MKQRNLVNIGLHRESDFTAHNPTDSATVSNELEVAIKHLIHRLRELGPIQPTLSPALSSSKSGTSQ